MTWRIPGGDIDVLSVGEALVDFISTEAADKLEQAGGFRPSAFALSQESSRTTVLDALRRARDRGCLISLEPNYHPSLWDADGRRSPTDGRRSPTDGRRSPTEPAEVFSEACQYVDVAKPSRDDCQRLFGAHLSLSKCAQRFHDWGVGKVVLTQGAQGISIYEQGQSPRHVKSREVPVADATGAGDAFWAGFLVAILDSRSLHEAVLFGREVAEIKLRTVGLIAGTLDGEVICRRVAAARSEA